MPFADIAVLIGAGLLAGAINALAGGGTIFTFSAMMAVGVPPVVANASSSVAVLPGQIASALAYRDRLAGRLRRLVPYMAASAVGAVAGSLLLLATDDDLFEGLVPWLILFATLLYIAAPRIAAFGEGLAARREAAGQGSGPKAPATLLQTAVAVYGGYFGAGAGIMLLATLSLTEGRDYHRRNAAKNLLSALMQSVAVTIFVIAGSIDWPAALTIAAAAAAGGYGSVLVARLVPQKAIRVFVIATGLALSGWYFVT